MTYNECSANLVLEASVAAFVLMGAPDDIEFIPLRPKPADEKWLAELGARWPGRNLGTVGIVGLVGTTPKFALKEPLGPEQLSAVASAFLEYLHGVYCDAYAEQQGADLRRMWSLPDMRWI